MRSADKVEVFRWSHGPTNCYTPKWCERLGGNFWTHLCMLTFLGNREHYFCFPANQDKNTRVSNASGHGYRQNTTIIIKYIWRLGVLLIGGFKQFKNLVLICRFNVSTDNGEMWLNNKWDNLNECSVPDIGGNLSFRSKVFVSTSMQKSSIFKNVKPTWLVAFLMKYDRSKISQFDLIKEILLLLSTLWIPSISTFLVLAKEKERGNLLPSIAHLINQTSGWNLASQSSSIKRNATWGGLCFEFSGFAPVTDKREFFRTLFNRADKIWSSATRRAEQTMNFVCQWLSGKF